jgi:hypothetical protein
MSGEGKDFAALRRRLSLRKRSERVTDAPLPYRVPGSKDGWTWPGQPPTREAGRVTPRAELVRPAAPLPKEK